MHRILSIKKSKKRYPKIAFPKLASILARPRKDEGNMTEDLADTATKLQPSGLALFLIPLK